MEMETLDDYGYNSKTGEYQLFPLLPNERRLVEKALNGFNKASNAMDELARIAPTVADEIRDFFIWSNIPLDPSNLACKGESVCLELLDCNEPYKRRRRLRRKDG
ncbi:MAG: hypothetical protein IKZ88_05430 [Neisseriaceae bacterium]|nr:hypothetical protein [Neisseriaceae bacterium]MBR5940682.1 hypothetical protein [Neisseriaceae bacterium]